MFIANSLLELPQILTSSSSWPSKYLFSIQAVSNTLKIPISERPISENTNIWKYQYLKIVFWKIPISERPVEQTCKFRSVLIRQILSDMVWIPNVFFHIRIEPHTTNLYIFYPTAFFIKSKKLIQYFTLYVIIYNLILVILWKDLIIKNLKNDPEERIRIHIPIDSEDPQPQPQHNPDPAWTNWQGDYLRKPWPIPVPSGQKGSISESPTIANNSFIISIKIRQI